MEDAEVKSFGSGLFDLEGKPFVHDRAGIERNHRNTVWPGFLGERDHEAIERRLHRRIGCAQSAATARHPRHVMMRH